MLPRTRNIILHSHADSYVCCFFYAMNIITIQDFNSRLTIWTLIWNTCTRILARIKEATQSVVLFISIVTNSRYKSFSRKILWVSWNSKLDARNSKLKTRASKLDSWKHWELRIEFRVKTVNLHLTGTVNIIRGQSNEPESCPKI